jgi:hypothetical protein
MRKFSASQMQETNLSHKTRKNKITEWLNKFISDRAAYIKKLEKMYGGPVPGYVIYRGLILCHTSKDLPKRRPCVYSKKRLTPTHLADLSAPGDSYLWKNFDKPAEPFIQPFFSKDRSLFFKDPKKTRNYRFSPLPGETLGIYMHRLVEFVLKTSLSSYEKRIIASLLNFLATHLFLETPLSKKEQALFLDIHQMTLKKNKKWSDFKFGPKIGFVA